tara:strand:+ start:1987 stop:2151 length:165 start_codon:yes stop_codon:yes gene_type:complete
MKEISKTTGVTWSEKVQKWRASILVGATYQFLQYYDSELEAAEGFNKALKNILK